MANQIDRARQGDVVPELPDSRSKNLDYPRIAGLDTRRVVSQFEFGNGRIPLESRLG